MSISGEKKEYFLPHNQPRQEVKMTESQPTAKCIVYLDNENYKTDLEFAVGAYRLGIKNDQVATQVIAFLKLIEKHPELMDKIRNSENCNIQDI